MTANDEVTMAGPRLAIQVAELIRVAHQRSGMPHEVIASRLGVSVGRVSQILNGDGNFHVATVARVLKALGCNAELSARDSRGERIEFATRRRRSAPSAHDGEKDATTSRPETVAGDRVQVYHLSLVGESGGFNGLFVSTHQSRRQTIAGGHMVPVRDPDSDAGASTSTTFKTTMNFSTELTNA